jgi:hypothetical protein
VVPTNTQGVGVGNRILEIASFHKIGLTLPAKPLAVVSFDPFFRILPSEQPSGAKKPG